MTGPDLSGHGVFIVLAALVWLGLGLVHPLGAAGDRRRDPDSSGRRPTRASRRTSGRASRSVQPAGILVAAIVAMFVSAPLLAAGAPPAAAAGHPGTAPGTGPGTVATATHNPGQRRNVRAGISVGGTSVDESRVDAHQGTGRPADRSRPRSSASKSSKQRQEQPRPPRRTRCAATTPCGSIAAEPARRPDPLPRDRQPEPAPAARHHHSHRRVLNLPQHHTRPSQPPTPRPTGTAPQAGVAPQVHGGAQSRSSWATPSPRSPPTMACATGAPSGTPTRAGPNRAGNASPTPTTSRSAGPSPSPPPARQHRPAAPAQAAPAAPAARSWPRRRHPCRDEHRSPRSRKPQPAPASAAGLRPVPRSADHRHGPLGSNREQDPASPVDAGQVPVAPSTVPLSAQAQASTPAGQPGQASRGRWRVERGRGT